MFNFEAPSPTVLSITALNNYLREVLETDPVLQDLWVRGEISNFSSPKSGHLYFVLKDNDAQMRCVMWKTDTFRLRFNPGDGQMVEAHGRMSIYSSGGQVQLYVDELRPAGEGQLYAEFLRLKNKLEAEGLFDEARKRPIPALPKHVGVVTSATGAALQDILNTLARRRPDLKVSIAPTAVQGTDAPKEIIQALASLNALDGLDLILIARGGGSIEDLWAFNNEALARAIYASRYPVISGVGHETDNTLADFAADLRAPTPTAAAERASSITRDDLLAHLTAASVLLTQRVNARLQAASHALQLADLKLKRSTPAYRLANAVQRLDDLRQRLDLAATLPLKAARNQLEKALSQLIALSPLAVLSRGYAILTDSQSGQVIRSTQSVRLGQQTQIRLQDGSLSAKINSIQPGEDHD